MKVNNATSISLAIAAAGLFATVPVVAEESSEPAQVHCYGVNACKGQNDCKTANNACKGKGVCKGQGFVNATAEKCAEKGGTVGK
jgi:uncharacterized membrane protein